MTKAGQKKSAQATSANLPACAPERARATNKARARRGRSSGPAPWENTIGAALRNGHRLLDTIVVRALSDAIGSGAVLSAAANIAARCRRRAASHSSTSCSRRSNSSSISASSASVLGCTPNFNEPRARRGEPLTVSESPSAPARSSSELWGWSL
eukprot:CAMPEP_0176121294 /NCGR_PEP_ID=MMETSP0120_2-20121206/61046_1 /TAXON_ID=160619 /ORGANISM="Kryptoperidinium foliaceum, Strain CCMP 1326" /LENGTH=154 /DNA_ID=CAMNT_0017455825 /DNA_START=17 /DNA_END=478 /DNA_ORIENTATION=-